MAAASGYDGFISYSHKHDAVLGPALQSNLERFAKPWYRMRALRIFLDTADLSANPGLWPSIEDGLSSSQWFILLASADAADSGWVNREVQWWKDHRSPGPLLVVGTSPGLAWDEQEQDWAAKAPVPSALRGAFTDEPHWVDLSEVRLDSRSPISGRSCRCRGSSAPGKKMDELVGEHLRQHRRATRLAEGAVAMMTLLTALAVVFSILAIGERNNAIRERNDAIRQQAIAQSRQPAAESISIDSTAPQTARQLAVAAWRVFPTDQASSAMTTLLAEQQQSGTIYADPISVDAVAFSPDSKLLASAGDDGTVRVWNPVTGQPACRPLTAGRISGVNGTQSGVAFSPDSKLLASARGDGTVRVWNPVTGQPFGRPLQIGSQSRASGVAFSPNGKLLASADGYGTVWLWNPVTSRPSAGFRPVPGTACT